VINAFSHRIMAKWQFQDFCKENSRNNEEFRHAVEKMIMVEEKTKERFPYRNNRENNRDNSDRRNFSNIRHPDRKRGPDNTVAMADKTKKNSKFRRFEDIENMHCI
jgi:lipopolysaccharide biosynthesis protein